MTCILTLVNEANVLLRSLWVLLSATAIASGFVPFLRSLSLHGRLISPHSSWMVWKGWFGVFYAIGWLWNGLFLVLPWLFDEDPILQVFRVKNPSIIVCLIALECHLFRRMMESWAITEFGTSKMHCSACILGVGHYVLVTISIVLDPYASTATTTCIGPILGGILFLIASVHQMCCNLILTNLKLSSNGAYGLPTGDWFELTWSPLYLTEILIYISFAIMSNFQHNNLLLIALWVLVNQGISADRAASWYLKTFPKAKEYNRAKLIPFVW
ncbi:hypothetical protein THRCLA_11195 [Thraustotheca clavata]|uniref:3-oxo-5-alpha-steroid 4-dehydrogenase C-terminal domain-containing protein n=1 Tax=Thraustotheca clavata TaxID=74557 RepID=A0A1V9Y8I4_9STRA|nr:hypothetical protein THRCLA_11195 [Thraustotheca clavata]